AAGWDMLKREQESLMATVACAAPMAASGQTLFARKLMVGGAGPARFSAPLARSRSLPGVLGDLADALLGETTTDYDEEAAAPLPGAKKKSGRAGKKSGTTDALAAYRQRAADLLKRLEAA